MGKDVHLAIVPTSQSTEPLVEVGFMSAVVAEPHPDTGGRRWPQNCCRIILRFRSRLNLLILKSSLS